MKRLLIAIILMLSTGSLFCQETYQHQVPSLQIGLGGMDFMKGALDAELISQMIAEKQQEVKVQLIRNMMLHRVEDAGGLLYGYMDNVFSVLVADNSPDVITRSIVENTVNVAFVYAFADYYLSVLSKEQKISFNKLAIACGYALPGDYKTRSFPNSLRKLKSTYTRLAETDSRSSRADEAEELTALVALYLDIAAEVVRNNETLFRLGLMRSNTSGVYSSMNGYLNCSGGAEQLKEFTFLRKYVNAQNGIKEMTKVHQNIQELEKEKLVLESGNREQNTDRIRNFQKQIDAQKEDLEEKNQKLKEEISQLGQFKKLYAQQIYSGMESTLQLLTANVGLIDHLKNFSGWKLEAGETASDKIQELVQSVAAGAGDKAKLSALFDGVNNTIDQLVASGILKKEDNPKIARLLSFINEMKRGVETSGKYLKKSELLYHLNNVVIPDLQSMVYLSPKVIDLIGNLEGVAGALAREMLNEETLALFSSSVTPFTTIISNLYEFDQHSTYSGYMNLLPEIGTIFANDRIEYALGTVTSFLKNYTVFYTDENGKKGIQVDAESILSNLADLSYNKSRPLEFYFVVGANNTSFRKEIKVKEDAIKTYSYLGEKIGLKYKIWDWGYTNSFNRGETYSYYGKKYLRNRPASKPMVSNIHAILYGSGIMYSLINTGSTKDFNKPLVGAGLGITFFNDLDLNISYGVPIMDDNSFSDNFDYAFINVGVDILFIEYMKRLGKKRKKKK